MRSSVSEHPDSRSPSRYLWWLVRCQKWRVLRGSCFGSLWMVSLALPPYLLSRAIDSGLQARWAGAIVIVGLLYAWLGISRHRTMTRIRMDANFRTNEAVVAQVARLGASVSRGVASGELATIGSGDVVTIAAALTVMGPGVGAVVAFAVVGALLFSVSGVLAVVVLLGVPALALAVGPLLRRLMTVQDRYRGEQAALTAQLVDAVQGLRVLHAFGGRQALVAKYRDRSARLRFEGDRVASVSSWIGALGIGVPAAFVGVVTWLAARMAADGTISAGQLVAVYGYAAMLAVPVGAVIEGAGQVARGLVAAERVTAFLRLAPSRPHRSSAAVDGDVLPSDAALHDPQSGVRVDPGVLTMIAAERPRDSASVIERLSGFVESEAAWGDRPIRSIDSTMLRSAILVADNDAAIFAGSLRRVLDGASDHGDDELREAVRAACAEDVVRGLPGGLAGWIGSSGHNLSAGQRQRVRLARALLADPAVLLLVEPTSSLDAHTEALAATSLQEARRLRTTVVTTASPALLAEADVVHLLVNGRVAASGTHAALVATCAPYRRLILRDAQGDVNDHDRTGTAGTAGSE